MSLPQSYLHLRRHLFPLSVCFFFFSFSLNFLHCYFSFSDMETVMESIRDVRRRSAYRGYQTPSECFVNLHVCERCQQMGPIDLIIDLN